jgi:hypothetical protein
MLEQPCTAGDDACWKDEITFPRAKFPLPQMGGMHIFIRASKVLPAGLWWDKIM